MTQLELLLERAQEVLDDSREENHDIAALVVSIIKEMIRIKEER